MTTDTAADRQLFVSRAGEDKAIALRVDRILRDAGYATLMQDRDFGHTSFMTQMADALALVDKGARVVALYSRAYQGKDYCLKEAHYPLIGDPANRQQRLIVLRIDDCQPNGLLRDIPACNIASCLGNLDALRRAVLAAVDPARFLSQAPFAHPHSTSARRIIHPEVRPVPGFTAREAELEALATALFKRGGRAALTNATGASAAIKGIGGVGKSVLARQYAWINRERYKGVWWLRAESRETLLDDLVALGSRLDTSCTDTPDREAAARIALDNVAENGSDKPWLLVYDNAEAPDQIEMLTPANGAHVLITTRWADWYGHAEEVPVGVFPLDMAVEFLLARARGGAERPAQTRSGAIALAQDLGCLPLALAIARAHAWGINWTFEQYRSRLAQMLERVPTRMVDYPHSIAATFTMAIDKAAAACPEAERLLAIAAFLAPERIPLEIITDDVMGKIEKGEAVAALADVSLISCDPSGDADLSISVHRLVQAVMRRRLAEKSGLSAEIALRLVARAFPGADRSPQDVRNWPACARLFSHALSVLEHGASHGMPSMDHAVLAGQVAIYCEARADYLSSERLKRASLNTIRILRGEKHAQTAVAMNNLAQLLRKTNRHAEAEILMRTALAVSEKALGASHPSVAVRLNNLATLLHSTERADEAAPLMRRALAIDEAHFGPGHASVALRLNNLAQLVKSQSPHEAEALMRRALGVDEARFGARHPTVARDLNNLAELLRALGRAGEAEPLMRRGLAIDESSFGPDHPNVAIHLNNLAQLLQTSGRHAEAEPLMRRALMIDESTFGPEHSKVAMRLNNLALLLLEVDRLVEAEPLMRRAVAIAEESLGSRHPDTELLRANLADLLYISSSGRTSVVPPSQPFTAQLPPKRGIFLRLLGWR